MGTAPTQFPASAGEADMGTTPSQFPTSVAEEDLDLVRRAQKADEADHALGIREALRKYSWAVFWSLYLSLALVMDGYDIVIIGSFYGQTQFKQRFGDVGEGAEKAISAKWQSGLSNSSLCGQIIGLAIVGWAQDKFGNRPTMMFFLVWMIAVIFIPVFAPSLPVLAVGELLCGIGWGTFQTCTTAFASEIVPTVLRPYVTAWVCMCWGLGITISSAVVRAVAGIHNDWGWRLPFALQWVWPIPLLIGVYLAPESPWNCVRRGKMEQAMTSLRRLGAKGEDDDDFRAKLAYIVHTTNQEKLESADARFIDCFKGINLRRTEINAVVWAAQILCGNAILGYVVVFLQKAGWSEIQSFNLNISLSVCYLVGGVISWFLMARLGRATIYMSCLALMLVCLLVMGGLGCVPNPGSGISLAIGIVMVVNTLINMIGVGPVCYPIVAETPSGRLRYKTIVIGRVVYNITGIFNNTVTPRMLSEWGWAAKSAFFYAGTNILCLIWCWFRLPETKDRSFGEIDLLFEHRVPARKFKYTDIDQFAVLHESSQSITEKKDTDEQAEYA